MDSRGLICLGFYGWTQQDGLFNWPNLGGLVWLSLDGLPEHSITNSHFTTALNKESSPLVWSSLDGRPEQLRFFLLKTSAD